jgi:hypothetical protein
MKDGANKKAKSSKLKFEQVYRTMNEIWGHEI